MKQLETKFPDQCHFVESGVRCEKAEDASSPFCAYHKDFFSGVSNQELIEEAAKCSKEVVYVSTEKKLATTTDPEVMGRWTNYLNELRARGYEHEEILSALSNVSEALGIHEDVDKQLGIINPKWRKFEKLVAGIHKTKEQGAEVVFDDKVVGKRTGEARQIDVSVRFQHGFYEYLMIIECKDYKKRVSVDKVEALRTKREDVGADKAIMVSPHGFQKGAVKAAKAYDIELFTLKEEVSDWTRIVKEEIVKFPFPTKVAFEHPHGGHYEQGHTYYDEVLLYRDETSPPVTLEQIVKDAAIKVYERGDELPCEVYVPFKPELFTEFPEDKSRVRLSGVAVTFESYEWKTTHEIDMPPKIEKYVYSDIEEKHKHEFLADAVPIGPDTVLEPGKFYSNSVGKLFKCIAVNGNVAIMVFLDSYREVVKYRYEFVEDIARSNFYLPIAIPSEVERLENIYRSLEGNS